MKVQSNLSNHIFAVWKRGTELILLGIYGIMFTNKCNRNGYLFCGGWLNQNKNKNIITIY